MEKEQQQQQMTSSSTDDTNTDDIQLKNGEVEEDPYKSEGRIEFKIENLSDFVEEPLESERTSDPIYLRGVPWNIYTILYEHERGQEQDGRKRLHFRLEYNGSTDPSCNYGVIAKLRIMAQKKQGCVEHVFEAIGHKTKFNGIQTDSKFLAEMTVEDLMNPDRGLYDAQADCITLAADLTVKAPEGFGKYVLVAENELKLDKFPTIFSMQVGQLEWEIDFDYYDRKEEEEQKVVLITCQDLAKATSNRGVGNNKVLLELFGYHRNHAKAYSAIHENCFYRHLFTRKGNSMGVRIPADGRHSDFNNLLFTFRVFKECNQFPDFTKETAAIGRNTANVILRVDDQQFHANRQLLATLSGFFDRMFHGDYTAATQQEVELSLITHSPELFHDFILVLCVSEALPNSMNVEALYRLADFYDAENVNKKCDQHLRMAREMPIEERVLLARDHGSKETQDFIVESADLEQSKRINRLIFMQNRS